MQSGLPDLTNNHGGPTAVCVIWEIGDVPVEDLFGIVAKILDKPTIERCSRLYWEKDRKRYLCSHFLRRALLSGLTGVPMDNILFTTNRYGKPFLFLRRGQGAARQWNFNVSSSGRRIAFLATNNGQCGIDIESFSDRERLPDLNEMSKAGVFSRREKAFLRSGPGSLMQRFYQIWTLKEAYLKYTGRGLGDIEQTGMFDLLNLQQPMNDGLWGFKKWSSKKVDAAAFYSFKEDHALSVVLNRDQAMPQVHELHDEQVFSLVKGTFPGKRKSDSYA